jgi:hypothetical protein
LNVSRVLRNRWGVGRDFVAGASDQHTAADQHERRGQKEKLAAVNHDDLHQVGGTSPDMNEKTPEAQTRAAPQCREEV